MAESELPDAPWATPKAAPSPDSDLPDAPWATPTGRRVAFTPGQEKYAEDEALLAKNRGVVPDAAKAGLWSAGNTALLNAPRLASATYTSYAENKPLKQALKEQTEYEEALSRQHPTASKVGTGIGLVGGLAVPLGPVATLGKAAGAATAAKFGATAGKVAEGATVGSTLSGASGAIGTLDPREALKDAVIGAGVGGALAPAVGALGNYFTKLPAVVDSAGNLVPEAQNAIRVAFEGRMSPEAIKSFEAELVSSFQKKGISPEVAKEALLAKEGVTPTKSLVTGEAAPKVTEDIAAKSAIEGSQNINKKVESLIGTPPGKTEVAEELFNKATGEIKNAGDMYEVTKSLKGEFPATIPLDPEGKIIVPEVSTKFIPYIQKALADKNVPISFENTGASYPNAKAAMKYMMEGPVYGNYPHAEGLTPNNIQEILKTLNDYSKKSLGDAKDLRAIKAIKTGFMETIKDHILDPAMFTGDGAAVLKSFQDAPVAWKNMKDAFFPDKGAGAAEFKRAMNSFVDQATRKISDNPTQGMLDTAQYVINSSLIKPQVGTAFYDRLETAFGKNSPELETVKKHIRALALDTGGDLSKLPEKLNGFLKNSPTLAQRVFKPEELSQLRRLSETARLITERPIPQQEKDDLFAKAVGKAIRLGAAGLGQIFHGPMGAVIGYLGTHGAERVTEAISTGAKRKAEMAGAAMPRKAPEMLRAFDKTPSGASLVRNVEAVKPVGVEGYQEPTMLPPLTIRRDRTARASGGRISNKLVASVERAKKLVNNSTKPLLRADDTHIAKALEIANQNLEG